jgi:hypothetical protein
MAAAIVPIASVAAQSTNLSGCMGGGVAPPADYYFPEIAFGFVIVSDERRNDQQLADTFSDSADALSRLHAWCWTGQAERVFTRDQLTIDISIHTFIGPEGATLAQYWFGYQRMNSLGLKRDVKTREQLQSALSPVNIEALDGITIYGFSNETEHTLYARRQDLVARITVTGESANPERSQEFVAYQVLAMVFHVNLFNYPRSIP